jgi:hypothetical protein
MCAEASTVLRAVAADLFFLETGLYPYLYHQRLKTLVGKPEGGKSIQTQRRRWEDDVKTARSEEVDWIHVVQVESNVMQIVRNVILHSSSQGRYKTCRAIKQTHCPWLRDGSKNEYP